MNFVCESCQRRDCDNCAGLELKTYCDCQHRGSVVDPHQLGGPVVPVDGDDSVDVVPDDR